jgi:hypothetical protein
MLSISVPDFILTMATGIFAMGIISLAIGLFLLLSKVGGKDIRTIAQQATKLAQKGLAEEVAGLVGNASSLVDALNQLVRTAAGIGIFLIFVAFGLFAGAYYLVLQVITTP